MSYSPSQKTVFTLVFVFGLLALIGLRVNSRQLSWNIFQSKQTSPSPQDAIYGMIDAERAGDTKAYLDAFSGSVRNDLLQVIKEDSESKFASYLTRNAAFQGVAITITDRPSPEEAQARVEYIYGDRNEVQNLYMKREGKKWKVFKMAGAEQKDTPLPFGSRVTE